MAASTIISFWRRIGSARRLSAICACASPCRWRRRATGPGPTRSNVAVATVANLVGSYSHRIRSNGASQARRSHVEEEVRRAVCDLDLATERRGSPHTLIATKNQASYGRRAKQRRQDLENVAALTG